MYLFSFSRQARPCMRQAWSCAICESVCLARHTHIILALTRLKNAPALFASLLMEHNFSVFLSRSDLWPFFFLHFFPLLLGIWSILGEKVEKVIKIIMLKSLRWVGSRRSFPFLSFSESYTKNFLFVSGSLWLKQAQLAMVFYERCLPSAFVNITVMYMYTHHK